VDIDRRRDSATLGGVMLPVTHTDLLVILALTVAITITGFSYMAFVAYRIVKDSKTHFAELARMATAVAGMVCQEEEKTRALLREHGWPR
jgi:hypothetical protein